MTDATKSAGRGIRFRLVAVALIALILAIVVIVVFVIPAVFGGSSGTTADVLDIASEPQTTWKYDWAGDNNPEFLDDAPDATPVGDDQALVWPAFDLAAYTDAIGTDLGWYEGYDQQYDDGYAAGLEFRKADDAYHNDTFPYSVPPAHESDFFPEGAYGNYDEFLGFQDGFTDAAEGLGAGANKRERPVDPGFVPAVTLLNAATGEVLWTVDLSEVLPDIDFLSVISAYDVEGSNAIALVIAYINQADGGSSLITLDRGNGDTLSTVSADGQISVAPFEGDLIISVADADGESATIGRYAVNRVDKKPRWSLEFEGTPFVIADNGFVIAYGEDSGAVFDGADGKKAPWGDDISYSIFYQFVGDQLIRRENSADGSFTKIEGWSVDGASTWSKPAVAESLSAFDGSIFTMQAKGSGFQNLQRVSTSDGRELWQDMYAGSFDNFLGVAGDSLLLSRGSAVVVLDLQTGKEREVQNVGDFVDVFEGERLYYVPAGEELAAYSYTDEGVVWSMGLDDGQSITTLGAHLVLIDADTSTVFGLAAK